METMNNGPMKESGSSAIIAVVAVVVGLAVGFGAAWLVKPKATEEAAAPASVAVAPSSATKAADLRVVLNALEREHVDLASIATRAGFDGRADFAASATQLDTNSRSLSDAVGSVYGKDAGDKFYEIWKSHIGFFVDYTVAAKKNDKPGMDKAVSNLNGYVEAISTFLSSANPNLPKDAVAQLITAHVGLLKDTVDAYGAKDYTKSYAQQHAAYEQIGTIADTLAGAIVKQKPGSFTGASASN